MSWPRFILLPAMVLAASALSACDSRTTAEAATLPRMPQARASIQELMQAIVDPSADALWESVSSTVTAQGVEDKRPESDDDWQHLRHLALTLSEAGNLLAMERPVVAHPGKALEDAHITATLSAPEIQKRIDADRPAFNAHALTLQAAAQRTLKAIDDRDIDAFMQAGAQLDQACEACHRRYWYPNDRRP
jgi:hypothetical protein